VLLEGGGNLYQVRPHERFYVAGGMSLKETVGYKSLPLTLFGSWKVACSTTYSPLFITCCLAIDPKGMGPLDHGLKPPNPWAEMNLPCFFKS
jgi:hypothetical protein